MLSLCHVCVWGLTSESTGLTQTGKPWVSLGASLGFAPTFAVSVLQSRHRVFSANRESRVNERIFIVLPERGIVFFFQLSLSPHWRANFFPENHQQISPMSLVQSSIKCPFPGEGKSTISIDKTSESFLLAKVPSLIIFLNNMPECLRKATIHVCYRRHWLLNQGKMTSPKIYPLYAQNIFTLSLQYPFLYGHCKNETVYSASLEYHLQLHCFQKWKNIVTHEQTGYLEDYLSSQIRIIHMHTYAHTHHNFQ